MKTNDPFEPNDYGISPRCWFWAAVISLVLWAVIVGVSLAGEKIPYDSSSQLQTQDQGQQQAQDQEQYSASQSYSLLLSSPMSTADCIQVYGALFAYIPWRSKDCVKIAMYHELRDAGLEEPAYHVLCSTRIMRSVYETSAVCLLTLMASHIKMCADRQERIEQFALEACEK